MISECSSCRSGFLFTALFFLVQVKSRLQRIGHGNQMALCRLGQGGPHTQANQEGTITGTPARPHAIFWRKMDSRTAVHTSKPRAASNTALPHSQTMKYLHDMRIVVRLIRRCSVCLAEELYWMCVNSGKDISLVGVLKVAANKAPPTTAIQHALRAVLLVHCEEMFLHLFYDELASSFAPHQSQVCSEATARSLLHSGEALGGACVRAIEVHFEAQCTTIATTSLLKHIGFSSKAAKFLGLGTETTVSAALAAGVLSDSCARFIQTLQLRGRVPMNDGIACLLQYIVKDMAASSHDSTKTNVGTDEMVRVFRVRLCTDFFFCVGA